MEERGISKGTESRGGWESMNCMWGKKEVGDREPELYC